MASGHVNRANRPNTWPQPTSRTVKKTLANREPSTHGTSRKCSRARGMTAIGGKPDAARKSPIRQSLTRSGSAAR